ncbi:MAG: replicative DNA helicase [Nevskia sp.]|nr:replicative DNA helicase [Nevskia sp.]
MSAREMRHPPHSMEAEQSVLGGLMLDNRRYDEVAERLSADDFFVPDHRVIFGGIAELFGAGKPADFVTLSEHLRQRDRLEEAGGLAYVGTLAADCPSAANVKAYAEIVRERAVLRGLIAAGQQIAELGYRPDGREGMALLDAAERELSRLRRRSASRDGNESAYGALMEEVERELEAAARGEGSRGLPTGFAEFDRMTDGLHAGDLVVIAGRPGMGKTSFAMAIVEHVGVQLRQPVTVFSLEMQRRQLMQRQVASYAGVPLAALRGGRLDDHAWSRVVAAGGALRAAPIVVDDTGALSPLELRARARRALAQRGLKLLVVDYLQLMQVPGCRDGRAAEIAEISRGLKALGKELGVPVIALSQLSRAVELRPDKRPLMADLRESGGIEQDADVIAFVYRDEYYHAGSADRGVAEIVIGKQRSGPCGTVRVAFDGALTRFDNLPAGDAREAARPAKRRGFRAVRP